MREADDGRLPLTPGEVETALREDPELTLVSDYLAGALPAAEARAVEARLHNDPAFEERVRLIVAAWDATSSRAGHSDAAAVGRKVTRATLDASWERFRATAEPRWRTGARTAPVAEASAHRRRDTSDASASRQMQRRLRKWQLAAGMIVVVGLPVATWSGALLRERRIPPQVHMASSAGGDAIPVRIADNAMAVLEGGGRLTWQDSTNDSGIRELFLEGEAQFQMQQVPVGRYVVVTPSARIIVTGSDFQVTAIDPSETLVRVQAGKVVLESRGLGAAPLLPLGTGETGRSTWRQQPRRVY